jgi:uncharacterized protein (TIGR03437 family)
MRYLTSRRLLPRHFNYLKACLVVFLALSLLIAFGSPDRRATAQGECRVECNATAPAVAPVSAPVSFAATATVTGCASSRTYEWDFGDGSPTSLQQNATHTYAAPGVYTWKLTTTAGASATTINTIAGGYGENAPARQAPFTTPGVIARDPQGRGLYVADDLLGTTLIRFINTSDAPATIAGKLIEPGKIRSLVGTNGVPVFQEVWDVPASDYLYTVRGMAASADGDLLYFSDEGNARIWVYNVSSRELTLAGRSLKSGNVGTLVLVDAGALGNVALHPATGEVYYISGNRIYKINSNHESVAVAGNGAATTPSERFPPAPVGGTEAPLLTPRDLAFDNAGNLFIPDTGHARIVKLDAASTLSLVLQLPLQPINPYPSGVVVAGDKIYVANGNDQTIIQVTGAGVIVAGKEKNACDYSVSNCGDGGAAASAQFNLLGSTAEPPVAGIEADQSGLYVLDQGNSGKGRVRYLNLGAAPVRVAGTTVAAGAIDTIAGSGLAAPYDGGPATSGALSSPAGVAVDSNGNLFIADTSVGRLRFVNRGSNIVTLFAGTPAQQVVEPGAIVTINKDVGAGATDGVGVNQAGFDTMQGLFVTNQGLFVADSKGGPSVALQRNGTIRFINTSPQTVIIYPSSPNSISVPPGHVARIAGGGLNPDSIGNGGFALDARLLSPADVAVNSTTGDIYIADVGHKAVRKISAANGIVTSLTLPASQYTGLGLDASGRLYIADFDQNRVLRESSAGSGSFAPVNATPLARPRDVAVDAGGAVYVTGSGDHRIARINSSGAVETFAGTTAGFAGDGGAATNAKLSIAPGGVNISVIGPPLLLPPTVNIAVGASGEVIFADIGNDRVRRIGPGSATCVKTGSITVTGDNPAPALSGLSPAFAILGGREFTLTVNGTGFITASKVRWNGSDRPTNYISSAVLTATIPATDLGQAGTANVTVFNPAPGGGVSNSLTIAISRLNPQPSLSSLSPNRAAVGIGFALTLNGRGFTDTSVVRWNGSARPTTYLSDDQLRADIPASDAQSVGVAEVTVFNPEPGGGISAGLPFSIVGSNPIPAASRLEPQGVVVGGQAFTLEVFGSNFAAASKVRWAGQDRPTIFVSETNLSAQIFAADIAAAGTANVTVFTPAPGGGVSNALTMPIGKQASTVPATSFSGDTVAAESIASLFGSELATETEAATSLPLPTTLRGVSVLIRDATGQERAAPLFFVSPLQINYLVPPDAASGGATVIVKSADKIAGVGQAQIARVAPGLFSANASGQGVAAAVALCARANGAQTFLPVAVYDQTQQRFVGVPLDLDACDGQVYLILYGSGLRHRSGLTGVQVRVGSLETPALFAGAAPGFAGLDQVNAGPLPRALTGRGTVDIVVTVDNLIANTAQVTIK